MNSLQELNGFSSTSIDYIDERPAGVIFDRQFPLTATDITNAINTTVITLLPTINIEEVINYELANVRYRAEIRTGGPSPLIGSTVSFPSLPAGVSLTTSGNQYTLSGINSKAVWDAIKTITWTLPSNYASFPLWFLEVSIIYYDQATNQERVVDWEVYDDRFYFISQIEANASVNVGNFRARLGTANLTAFASKLVANTVIKPGNISMSSAFTIYAEPVIGELPEPMIVNSTLNVFGSEFPKYVFFSNQKNQIVLPIVEDFGNGTDIYGYQVNVTGPHGRVGTTSSSSNVWYYEGTKSEVNSQLNGVYFYPTKNRTDNSEILITLIKNGIQQWQRSFTVSYAGAGAFTPNVYTFNSSGSWIPTVEEYLYAIFDTLIVGAGGAGANSNYQGTNTTYSPSGGPGGGGGEVLYYTNLVISSPNYSVTVGGGGSGSGGSSSFYGYTASGGSAAFTSNYLVTPPTGRGGASGNGNQGSYDRLFSTTFRITGGGGGGAGGPASGYDIAPGGSTTEDRGFPGGAGISNSITGTSVTYGAGGPGRGPNGTRHSIPTAPGSGGPGGNHLNNINLNGKDGTVIIRTHT